MGPLGIFTLVRCAFCDRYQGVLADIAWQRSRWLHDEVPLGPVEECEDCGRLACPDCMHERDCCSMDDPDGPRS